MKKNYFALPAMIILLSFIASPMYAALSGVYTINSAQATGGSNYQTFAAFASDLNTLGVSGGVTVNVVANSGPYVEQVTFSAPAGVTSSNKVTINGNNNLITFAASSSGAAWTIALNSADWFVFNDLQVQGTGNSFAWPLLLHGGADNNMFTNCTFSCNANQGNGTGQIPVVVSGSSNNYFGTSNSGSNNTWDGCDLFGGYFGITMVGPTSVGTYNFGNKILNSRIHDFYYYGTYLYYHDRMTISGNTFDRATRTSLIGAGYGIYIVITSGTLVEKNKIQKLFEQNQSMSGTVYGMMFQGNTAANGISGPNIVRNNIISDIKWNGSIYGFMIYYLSGEVVHNTISLDHTASTGGSAYGMYLYSFAPYDFTSRNNLISITKGGSGSKYGVYYLTTGSAVQSNNNNYWVNGAGGNNYAGNYGGAQVTLANLQSASAMDAQSYSLDPQFANIATNDLQPTNAAFNNLGAPLGVVFDHNNAVRNATTPDIGALEFLTPVCNGAPGNNSLAVPAFSICPGESVNLGLTNLLSDAGLSYQWQSSTISNVGPFTNVANGTGIFYTAPNVTTNTWFNVVVTCTALGQSTSYSGLVMVSGPTSSTVPYYEGFEGIGLPNRLPNCSWNTTGQGASNLTALTAGSGNRVPRTGNGYASFANVSAGTSYYYTNPIAMTANITYSAALWYATEYLGYTNWTNLAILVGPNQNPTGMVQVASISPAVSGNYKLLDNTFTVPSSGNYYVAIRATSMNGNAMYLSWDDLSITIPCGPTSPNTPTLSTTISSSTVCAGQPVTLNANGADTYTWSNGQQGGSITEFPMFNATYTVTGTNALTGCSSSRTEMVYVTPSPVVYVVANNPVVCSGKPVVLTALGAATYAWSNGGFGSNIVVNPTSNTTYQVIGTNNFNCSTTASITVTVNNNPNVSVSANNNLVCSGDNVVLNASGASTYQWQSGNTILVGNPLSVIASGTGTYSVTGTDVNGCSASAVMNIAIEACVGLNSTSGMQGLKVYPSPTSGNFRVEAGEGVKTISVTDVAGRVIVKTSSEEKATDIDISRFAAGIYYVSINAGAETHVVKVVKH